MFIENDYTVPTSDVSGSIAVGGNVSIPNNYIVRSAYVGGQVIEGSFQNPNNAYIGSNCTINFAETFELLRNSSLQISRLQANGRISLASWQSNVIFTGNDPVLNVFNITVREYNELTKNANNMLRFDFNIQKLICYH